VFTGVTSASVGSFFIQGRILGTATLTAHANGFDDDTATITVDPSGFIINSPGNFTTNSFAANTNIQITSARLNPTTLAFVQNQPIRGGLTVPVAVTSSDETVGALTNGSLSFGPSVGAVNTAFDPISSGTTNIVVGVPAGFSAPTSFKSIAATVTAPGINLGNVVVGRDLQTSISISLDVAPPSPITVTVHSNSPIATITRDGTVEGGDTVTFTNVTTANVGSFFVQGRTLGTTTLTAQAAGYDDATPSVTVDPSPRTCRFRSRRRACRRRR
jgi:hypothetical protein